MVDFNYKAIGSKYSRAFAADCLKRYNFYIYYAYGNAVFNHCNTVLSIAKKYGNGNVNISVLTSNSSRFHKDYVSAKKIIKPLSNASPEQICSADILLVQLFYLQSTYGFCPRRTIWAVHGIAAMHHGSYVITQDMQFMERKYNSYLTKRRGSRPQPVVRVRRNSLLEPQRRIILPE